MFDTSVFARDGARFGLRTSFRQGKPNRSPKLLRYLQTEPMLGVNRRRFFFSVKDKMSTGGATGGASTAGEEELDDDTEMEDDSSSNVSMLTTGGTFIPDTVDGTVTEARYSSNRHHTTENMSEDLLNRHIQEPSRSIVKMTISTWRSKPSTRSAWRTRTDVGIAQ